MKLSDGQEGHTYQVVELLGSEETNRFFSNLGLVSGEDVTVISHLVGNIVVNIKDGRYGMAMDLAEKVRVKTK
ncbi:MAG: FeoA family protein [Bacillota bacterium]